MTSLAKSRPRAKRLSLGKESPRVTAIIKALTLKGYFCWRVNSSLTVLPGQASHGRRVIKGAPAGSPDIFVVLPVMATSLSLGPGGMNLESDEWGALCGLEVKTETGRQSPSQKAWQAKAERFGVRYAVVTGVAQAIEQVEVWSGARRRA